MQEIHQYKNGSEMFGIISEDCVPSFMAFKKLPLHECKMFLKRIFRK